ncbi:MAG: hypothetical protein QGH07_14945, partial [Alphaproteobacteria bacterium]|nr:hypothetical protein [Alphaproteobacteria bacterium]
MLTVRWACRFSPGALKRRPRYGPAIKPIRPCRRVGITSVVRVRPLQKGQNLLADQRVDQWAICCQAQHDIGVIIDRNIAESLQN